MNAHSPIMPKWATERGLTPLQWQTLQEDKARKLRMGFEGPPPVRILPPPAPAAEPTPAPELPIEAEPKVPYRISSQPWFQRKLREQEAMALTESFPLPEDINPVFKRSAHIKSIKLICAKAYNVTPEEIDSHRRSMPLKDPRFAAVYLVYVLYPQLSTPAIGKIFGGRDHTTVLNVLRKVRARMANEPAYAELIAKLRAMAEAAP
jgi:hypothetical protein